MFDVHFLVNPLYETTKVSFSIILAVFRAIGGVRVQLNHSNQPASF
jgi:hypothetical protein